MEALVRWNHTTMGLVSPEKFIPLAEATGLIIEIDRFVMKTAMQQISSWYEEGLNPGVLALNLAMKQLQQKNFVETLKEMMQQTKCQPEWIELEVTEGQIMTNPHEAINILNEISSMGIAIAVDDFGTGYSSLSYLKKLPVTKLKIDQSFIRDLPDDEDDIAISKAVIALAQSLNLDIIAEGVERVEQKEFLLENGCELIQGYLYAKPMPADEMRKRLTKQ
jgi:EAL domain-containing protein (putative c-di-GMP-specific phosphodiesterase class I)